MEADKITLIQWLNMWGRLCRGSAGISGFPIWVQLLAQMFFETIDRDGEWRKGLSNLVHSDLCLDFLKRTKLLSPFWKGFPTFRNAC